MVKSIATATTAFGSYVTPCLGNTGRGLRSCTHCFELAFTGGTVPQQLRQSAYLASSRSTLLSREALGFLFRGYSAAHH